MVTSDEGELTEVILYVQNMNAQVAFYRDQLKLHVEEPEGIRDFRDFYRVKLHAGACALILAPGEGDHRTETSSRLVFQVPDIHISRRSLYDQGVEIGEVHSLAPGMFVCEGFDPEGNAFALQMLNDSPYVSGQVMPTPPAGMAPTYVSIHSRRGQSILLLRDNKLLIAVEIILVIALQIASTFFLAVPFISFFLIIMGLLWLRGNTWTKLGLRTPRSWKSMVVSGVLFGIFFYLLQAFVVAPLILHLKPGVVDFTALPVPKGNVSAFVTQLVTTWTVLAFIEEMIYRAYLLNRITDVFGQSFPGWTLALFAQAIVFGTLHLHQGLAGVIETAIYGLLLGLLYLGNRRNLWHCIVAHGVFDTIFFSRLFLGI